MAWKPIADRIKDLPLVLAGPILRRVEKDNVSVWLALKAPCLAHDQKQLSLEVYTNGTGTAKGSLVMSGCRDTVSLGEHLHIVVLTAKTTSNFLTPGITYSYNVTGNGVDFTSNPDLCYSGFTLPTFSLPPADLNDLRIIHGSCRKLPAQGTDAMADINGMLAKAAQTPATLPTTRPHQLFLTGDQIYADDVDPLQLFLIRDLCEGANAFPAPHSTGKGLLNWTEELRGGSRYGAKGNPYIAYGSSLTDDIEKKGLLEVGRRSELLRAESGLQFPGEWEVPENHLIKLGEYYGMYLLMWSPILWPTFTQNVDEYPGYRNVFSDKYFPSDDIVHPTGSSAEVIAENSAESGGDKSNYASFERSVIRAKLYQDELLAIRRGLANVPTYMICDDHEITDDWFLDINWCEKVLSRVLGNRIVQNGLTAYTLFQGWGNNPIQFEQPMGQRLLDIMPTWDVGYDAYASPLALSNTKDCWETMGVIIGMPALYATLNERRLMPQHPNRLKHHYHIAWDKHEVVVMDTRTARDFPGETPSEYAALISRESLVEQLQGMTRATSTIEVTFLVIATPISGIPNIEESLAGKARLVGTGKIAWERFTEDFPDPLAIPIIASFVDDNERNYFTDAEVYSNQPKGLQDLYGSIAQAVAARQQYNTSAAPGRIVVLSGDVHYGFTNRVEYWATRFATMAETDSSPGATHFVLAQLCASALKNEKDKYIPIIDTGVGTFGRSSLDEIGYFKDEILYPKVYLGWIPPVDGTKLVATTNDTSSASLNTSKEFYVAWYSPTTTSKDIALALKNVRYKLNLVYNPDWTYRITYVKSLMPPPPIGAVLTITPPSGTQPRAHALRSYLDATANNKRYLLEDSAGSEAVGKNNLGEVTFRWGNTEETKLVQHNLWWSKADPASGVDLPREPHSKFAVVLGKDEATYPKPTYPYLT